MGDDESRAAAPGALQRRLQPGFGGGVERAGRLVEHEDRRVLQQRAGDGEPLAFAAGEVAPALADVVAALGVDDEIAACASASALAISSRVASGLPMRRLSSTERASR